MDKEHQIADMLLRATCEFQGESMRFRELTRDEYRKAESNEENILRIRVDGLIAHLAAFLTSKIESTDDKISYQVGLASSFVRTHFLAMGCVLDGDLIEAVVLTRKQLESLARLHEIDSKPLNRLFKKTPNISNVLQGESGRLYGELSEVAHFSTPRVTELLHVVERGGLVGPSLHPRYNKKSHACSDMEYFVAIYFCGWFVEKIDEWYPDSELTEERVILSEAILLALDCGVLRKPHDK